MFNSRQIKAGTILNDKYEIESILGEGGFGITYLAKDINMNEKVAIKEYFPSALGTRDTTAGEAANEITVIKGEDKEAFEKGLRGFEDEASNLARFNKEAGIVSVKSFFKENNTGYMVMEYIDGVTLKDYLKEKGGRIPCLEAISMMKPVMDSLSLIHGKSIIHRDISPDNIMVTKNGTLKLIDFGAARYVGANDEKSLTVMLKAGFAPPEQYRTHGKQGAWTDIYALSATMYQMISGVVPEESIERIMGNDNVIALNKLCPDVPENISKAIEKGMSVQAEDRYQSIEELQAGFSTEKQITTNKKSINKKYIYALAGIVAVVIVEVFVFARSAEKSEIKKETKLFEETVAEDTVTTSDVTENNSDETVEEMAEETNDEIVEEEAEEKYLYTSAKVNIRSAPNEEKDNIIAVSEVGQEFEVLSRDVEGWITVKYEDDEAYMSDKYLISKLDYDTWKAYYEKLIEKENVEKKIFQTWTEEEENKICEYATVNETDSLQGAFDDYDGDGKKELFIMTYSNVSTFDWLYDYQATRILWLVNSEGIYKACEDSETEKIGNYYFFEFDNHIDPNCINASIDAVNEVGTVGKYKYFNIHTEDEGQESNCMFSVYNNRPCKLNLGDHITELDGICFMLGETEHIIYSNDVEIEDYLLMDDIKSGNRYNGGMYPWYFIDGKTGQMASCVISDDDFMQIEGANKIKEKVLALFQTEQKYITRGLDCDSTNVTSLKTDSIMYNEAGFFAINYIVYTDINGEVGRYDKSREFEGVAGHALVSYRDGELKIIYTSWGKYKRQTDLIPVLLESDFNNFEGIDYYKK